MLVKQLKINQKTKKVDFLSMLLGTLGATLLGNMLVDIGVIRTSEETIRAVQGCYTICNTIFWLILKWIDIIKVNPNLMVFIQEVIYLR